MVSDNESFVAINADGNSVSTSSEQSSPPALDLDSSREAVGENSLTVGAAFEDEPTTRSIASAPERFDDNGKHTLDSHEFPPFAAAVPATSKKDFPPPPPVETIEVDTSKGTIRIEGEDTRKTSESDENLSSSTELSQYHQCWLIVFFRKCVRKTIARSRTALKKCGSKVKKAAKSSSEALKKYSPKAKEAAKKSFVVMHDASMRSVVFVKSRSIQFKSQAIEFNEKHKVQDKARASIKKAGKNVKNVTKATVKGVKKASSKTMRSAKDFEARHQILAKSQYGLAESRRLLRNAWNGKPLNEGAQPFSADIDESTTPVVEASVVIEEKEEQILASVPPASSE